MKSQRPWLFICDFENLFSFSIHITNICGKFHLKSIPLSKEISRHKNILTDKRTTGQSTRKHNATAACYWRIGIKKATPNGNVLSFVAYNTVQWFSAWMSAGMPFSRTHIWHNKYTSIIYVQWCTLYYLALKLRYGLRHNGWRCLQDDEDLTAIYGTERLWCRAFSSHR